VLLEDIHWADDSSLDAIAQLATALARQRLLIVCLARPTLFTGGPTGAKASPPHPPRPPSPVARDSRRLVDEILQKDEQVPPVAA